MHCFACDMLLSNPTLDKPTGRYYCSECMELTNEVILCLSEKDFEDSDFLDTLEILYPEEVSIEDYYKEDVDEGFWSEI